MTISSGQADGADHQPLGACPVCGGGFARLRHGWLSRCGGCGVLRSNLEVLIPNQPTQAAIDEELRAEGLEGPRTINNARLLDAVRALVPAGARLLDVGSGPGFLLGDAARLGFAAQGVEPDANTVGAARARGASVRHGYFPAVLGQDETFDVIAFNDVLEHIPDLAGALAACAIHLAPGGVLCLNCPDRRGFFYRTAAALDRLGLAGPLDRLWQKGLPSPHIWYFTPDNLAQAAARHGFAPVRQVRLETLALRGLWSRIRYVKDQPLLMSLAAFVFSLATYPLARMLPGDAVVCLFRKT
jgi:2-polyprenyl-3-methyl-5-hydroxy-6-metoxy-1,4-benzoquinol methylase